jgi:hypothetical protein
VIGSFPLPLFIPLFARGDGGVPTSIFHGDDLGSDLEGYEHSISDAGGFESSTVSRNVTLDEALLALREWLGRAITIVDADVSTIWDGQLNEIEANFGPESRTVSLGPMANQVVVKYTLAGSNAAATTAAVNDADSQALYGVKTSTQSFEATDSTDAANKANRILAELKNPQMRRSSQAATGQPAPLGARLRCSFAGWAAALDWLTTSNTTTSTAATDAQIKSLLTAYNAVNAFFSSDQSQIVASGVSAPQTIQADTTYRKAIEDLIASGNSSSQALAWGVYENRVFQSVVSAKNTPSTVTYRRYLGDGRIFDLFDNIVPWWRVRPNAIYEVIDLYDIAPVSTAQDAAARSYIARVRFSANKRQMSLDLEGANGESIDKLLARVR